MCIQEQFHDGFPSNRSYAADQVYLRPIGRRAVPFQLKRQPPSLQRSWMETSAFDAAQVARMAVHEVGTDFGKVLQEEEYRVLDRDVLVI